MDASHSAYSNSSYLSSVGSLCLLAHLDGLVCACQVMLALESCEAAFGRRLSERDCGGFSGWESNGVQFRL
jgi:hypothetical protein